MGALMYVSYAFAHGAWSNPALIGTALFVSAFLTTFARLSSRIEEWANALTARISVGRLARFAAQFAFNWAGLAVLVQGGAIRAEGIATVGGLLGAAVITTLASQGAQYFGVFLFQRRIGDYYLNVLIGLSANVMVTALATAGLSVAREVFLVSGIGFGIVIFGLGLLSDLRSHFFPRRSIGIFFGTFNPFHNSHLELIRRALDERRLEKVIVHPTGVPWLHVRALNRGEIRVACQENGFQIYETTDRADIHADYFPTGNAFLAPETRWHLIRLAVEEAGLSDRVEVAYMADTYAEKGFFGVVAKIRRAHPGVPLHGLHGSDAGGMHARLIMDECGWIYPIPFLRRNGVSATAIRDGQKGLTATAVAQALEQIAAGAGEIQVQIGPSEDLRKYQNQGGSLVPLV